jgi:F-type H+-transporting ATPase subunit b
MGQQAVFAADETPSEATEEKHDESDAPHTDEDDHDHASDDHADGPHHKDDGDHAHDEEKGGGMKFKADTALWSLVTFVVFVLVLRVFAWGPLTEGLDNREAHFRSQLAEAEAARIQAERMLKEHAAKLEAVQDEVKAIIEEAKRDAEHTKNDIIETAQKEAKATQDRAIHEIERSKDAALKELFDTMSSQVASATEHVIGRSINGDDQNRLIDEALSQFSGS